MNVVILANAPEALTELCGVSLLERQLRILQRLGFSEVTIASDTPNLIQVAIEQPSWARNGLAARIVSRVTFRSQERALFLPGNIYCDARLIKALTECESDCVLVDSAPPNKWLPLLQGMPNDSRGFVSGAAVTEKYDSLGNLAVVDAAQVPAYVVGMRRNLRPMFFPAPSDEQLRLAERLVFNTGQNGTLDIPAYLQSPVETWIMRRLCRTSITPNQITAFGILLSLGGTALFATGYLWLGMIPALAMGVIDGLDGKQARVKIETTKGGEVEHALDFFVETSWWAALAFWFWRCGQLPKAWFWFAVMVTAELIDQLAKRSVREGTGRQLDDVSMFDRFVRLIGARRDIYIWTLVVGLCLGAAAATYRLCAIWGVLTATVHGIRAVMLRRK